MRRNIGITLKWRERGFGFVLEWFSGGQWFTLQGWDTFPHRNGPLAGKLAQGHFQQEDGDPRDAQHGQVGD